MSKQNREASLSLVLSNLSRNENELRQILPADMSYERFIATTQQALLQFPQILDCTAGSLTQACMKAAYDGLRIDGREAAIIERKQKGKGRNQGMVTKLAQYMPMAFGLVQQIYRGGEVSAMEVDVVYEGDDYQIQKGTNPGIHHVPNLERPKSSKIIAAYSIATLKSGYKTFEVLGMADLAAIKGAASYDTVWKAWPGEMSKKSAVRRHRKMLPLGDRDVIDVEQGDMYDIGAQSTLPQSASTRPARPRLREEPQNQNGVQMLVDEEPRGKVIDTQAQRLRSSTSKEEANLKRSDENVGNEDRKMSETMTEDPDEEDDLDARIDAAMKEADTLAARAVDTVLSSIVRQTVDSGAVTITNFGTFKLGKRKAFTTRNPHTGKPMHVSAQVVMTFKPSKGIFNG